MKLITNGLKLTPGLICFCILLIACKQKTGNLKSVEIDLPYSFKREKAEFLSVKAFQLRKEKKYDEAINVYQQAMIIEPDNPKLFFDISECYANKNDWNNALFAMDTAIKLDSLNPHFYNNRGLYNWKINKDENAIEDYKKAISLGSQSWVTYANLSIAYYGNRMPGEACETFKTAKNLGLTEDFIASDNHLILLKKFCK